MRIAFPTDEHFPYQDDQAREVAMMLVQDFQPDMVVVGSDGMDFYDISNFDKDPNRVKLDLQHEIDYWKEGVREWKMAAPQATFRFIPGNHEDRLRKWLWRHPEVAGLEALQLENLLDLKGLGVEYDEQDYLRAEIDLFGKVSIRHGRFVRQGAGMSARAELEVERYAISVCTGHTHRGGTVHATTRSGIVIGQECFCLCRLDPTYMARPNWQQGIVLIDVDKDHLNIEPVIIERFQRTARPSISNVGTPTVRGGGQKRAYWRGEVYAA